MLVVLAELVVLSTEEKLMSQNGKVEVKVGERKEIAAIAATFDSSNRHARLSAFLAEAVKSIKTRDREI